MRLVESVLAPAELRKLDPVGQAEGPALSIYCSSTVMLVETAFVLDLKKGPGCFCYALGALRRGPQHRGIGLNRFMRTLATLLKSTPIIKTKKATSNSNLTLWRAAREEGNERR